MTATARLLALLLLALLPACRTGEPDPVPAAPTVSTRDLAVQVAEAEAILADLLAGLKARDYSRFVAHDTAERRAKITPESFARTAEQIAGDIGECQSRQYLGRLDKQVLQLFLWKARFSKTQDEALVRLLLGEVDGRFQVFNFSISQF